MYYYTKKFFDIDKEFFVKFSMLFLILIGVLFFIIIAIFSFPQFSPIPYFPSNKKDLPLIIRALNLKNNQMVFDLGAGDGIVIFEAAKEALKKKLNTKFIAVEINPVLILILLIRRFFHPNKKNIRIVCDNIFSLNYKKLLTSHFSLLTFYLYISPWFLEKTISNIKDQISKFKIISYMYSVKSLKKHQKTITGKNKIYIYKV